MKLMTTDKRIREAFEYAMTTGREWKASWLHGFFLEGQWTYYSTDLQNLWLNFQ